MISGCLECAHRIMSEYFPANRWDPEEPSVLEGCQLDHCAYYLNPDEGCSDHEYRDWQGYLEGLREAAEERMWDDR